MLWRRKILYCTATLAGGCLTLALSKDAVIGKCEKISPRKKSSDEVSPYIYIPDSSDYFNENNGSSDWFPLFRTTNPVYWKLFMLTKSKNRSIRHKAIRLLTESSKLEKWEYMMIAQACGPTTAVGLARSSRIHRSFYFPPPFRSHKIPEELNKEILDLIRLIMNKDFDQPTRNRFLSAKRISKRILKKRDFNDDPETFEIYHSEQKKKDILEFDKLCLQILLSYSTIKSSRFVLIKNGVLKILWEVLNHSENQPEFQCLIAQILANFSLEEELRATLYNTGWIGVLASWSCSQYVNVSLPSAKALANLDTDDYHHSLYDNDVYLLHPFTRTSEKELNADIIFVHGLFGSSLWTWRQSDTMKTSILNCTEDLNNLDILERPTFKDPSLQSYTFCWPKDWLAIDFPNLRLLAIDYNTDIRDWKSLLIQQKDHEDLNTIAKSLMNKLIKANVGGKPIIWVTHSLGGILVKELLVEAIASNDTAVNSLAKNTTGVIFISVPHKGSEFATLLQSITYILQSSAEISQFHKGSVMLLSLHDKFMKIVQDNNIGILSFGETKQSRWGLDLVSEDSSNPGIGEFHTLDVDHLSTCKPESRDSKVFLEIREFLKAHIPIPVDPVTYNSVSELCNILSLIP